MRPLEMCHVPLTVKVPAATWCSQGLLPEVALGCEGAGLVRCLVENTRGLCRYLGWCRVHVGCLSCDGGTVVPLLDDVNPGAMPLLGKVPGVLGLPQLMAQYHSRFSS